jgi:ubiquinone/menaquinone biosynthesis C-methylase UbiE
MNIKNLWFWRNYSTNQWAKWWQKRQKDWKVEHLNTWQHPHRYLISGILKSFGWYSLMEIGCGAGANLLNIVKTIGGRQIGGCDVNPEMIELARKTFNGGEFKVCPADDIMISDSATDVALTDMLLIYVSPWKIKKHLQELKRITRKRIVLCEFHSTSFWDRWRLRIRSGLNAHNYLKLLEDLDFYNVQIYKIPKELWDDKTHQKFTHIIVAQPPRR